MSSFASLKSEVQTLVIDVPSAVTALTGTWVNRAITKLQRKHNFKVMEAEISYTTTMLTRELGIRPTDWKQYRGNPYYTDNFGAAREMTTYSSVANAIARWGNNSDYNYGDPAGVTEDDLGQVFNVWPFPDGTSDWPDGEYRVTLPYWKYLGQLIADNDTNWFSDNAEQWIIYQSVAEAFYANEDETRAQTWEVRAAKEYKDVMLLDKDRRLAETQVFVPHLGAYRPHTQE